MESFPLKSIAYEVCLIKIVQKNVENNTKVKANLLQNMYMACTKDLHQKVCTIPRESLLLKKKYNINMQSVHKFILSMQSSLLVEVWDYDDAVGQPDDPIDNFTIPLSVPLDKFNLSYSLTVQGKVGNLTLNYGNLTTDPTICPAIQPTCSGNEVSSEGNSLIVTKCMLTQ